MANKNEGEEADTNGAENAKKRGAPRGRHGRGPAWTFPKNPLEDAVHVARAIEDKNAGRPMRADVLAKAVGFNRSNDWRFLDLLRSANQYGLVQGTGANATVSIAKIGEDVVAPSSSSQRQEALVAAFRNVEDFKKVQDFYSGKKIPEDEFFENTLVRDFSIPRDRVQKFIEVFTKNLRYLNLFGQRGTAPPTEPDGQQPVSAQAIRAAQAAAAAIQNIEVREFLDSCFVVMPFGGWFDKYYDDIFKAAIKAAGFEPVRSDELFSSGSVVEQIWEQINKSTVLLADLSGRNPNVFYELGLAHAAHKPVVLTARNIDDVPFDLRHLRVAIYDVNEPRWSEKLTKTLTDFLKNAKAEPSKSIPQPFRDLDIDLERLLGEDDGAEPEDKE
jgi:hypothetical protein